MSQILLYWMTMDPSAEQQPQGQIINRKNARNISQAVVSPDGIVRRKNAGNIEPQRSSNIVPRNESSWRGKAAAIAVLGATLGGGAAVVDEIDGDGAHASAFEQHDTNAAGVESSVQSHTTETHDSKKDVLVRAKENIQNGTSLSETVFHDLTPQQQQEANAWVDMFKARLEEKPGYEKQHRQIPQQYKEIIQQTAHAYGIPEAMLYGIIAIENGGGPAVVNQSSGAVGVAQFLPDTARQYGLIVNEKQDQRKDPVLSIDAAGQYLRDHQALFNGDAGLTMWSYHAGVGNVYNAMRTYFLEEYDTDIGSYSGSIVANDAVARERVETKARELMKKDKLSFFKLVTNEAVKSEVISHLHDYSETYVPSILAILQLEEENGDQEFDIGNGLRVTVPKNTFPGR